jgi:hypothetical protein
MQRYTVYFVWKLLYMFRVVPPPTIRSAYNCIYSIWYLSHRYCYMKVIFLTGGRVINTNPVSFAFYNKDDVSFNVLNVHGSYKYSNIYIQQDATLHNLFHLETALHVSGGNSAHHQERIQLYLQHLVFVTPLLLPAAIYRYWPLVLFTPTDDKCRKA